MDNSEHIHKLSFSAWFGYILMGSFLLLLVFTTLVINVQDLISGKADYSDYLGIALMVFLMFPLGLLLWTAPFVLKIVVKAQGLEYHTLTCTLSTDWKDLLNVGYVKNTRVGKTLVIVPREGKIELRKWATPFRKILIQNPQDVQILVSQFRPSNGHSFETDILVNVSQQAELSNELEPL